MALNMSPGKPYVFPLGSGLFLPGQPKAVTVGTGHFFADVNSLISIPAEVPNCDYLNYLDYLVADGLANRPQNNQQQMGVILSFGSLPFHESRFPALSLMPKAALTEQTIPFQILSSFYRNTFNFQRVRQLQLLHVI